MQLKTMAVGACPPQAGQDDWRRQAVCAQTDPEAFFPDKGGSSRDAKAVCARCPVISECLEFALAHDERFGIWGGTSERERRRIGRERQLAADPGQGVPGVTARGDGRWGVQVRYRRPDGSHAQLNTTLTGSRARAEQRLRELRARAAELAAAGGIR